MCLGLTFPSAAQDVVGCLCHWDRPAESGTTCCSADRCPHVLFFPDSGPQHVLGHGLIPPGMQDLALLSLLLSDVSVGPFLQPVEVPLSCQHTHLDLSTASSASVIV